MFSWKDALISLSIATVISAMIAGGAAYYFNQKAASAFAAPFKISFKIS